MKVRRLILAIALAVAAPAQHAAAQQPLVLRMQQSGWLGFSYSSVRTDAGRVIVVDTIIPESPAARAGLLKADTIVAVNGLRATSRLMASLGLEPGDRVELNVRRAGDERTLQVTAAERPEGFGPMSNVFSFRTDSVMTVLRGALDSVRVQLDNFEMPRVFFNYTPGDSMNDLMIIGHGGKLDTIRIHGDSLYGAFRFFDDSLRSALDSTFFRIARPGVHVEIDGDSVVVLDSTHVMRMWPGEGGVWTGDGMDAFHFEDLPFRGVGVGFTAVAGMTLEELNPQLGSYFGADRGLLVLDVGADTPAADAGLRGGDVILRCAGNGVDSIRELRRAIARAEGDHVELVVLRERREIELELAIEG